MDLGLADCYCILARYSDFSSINDVFVKIDFLFTYAVRVVLLA
jgi:hypothetical protein